MKKEEKTQYIFTGTVTKEIYNNPNNDWKIYALDVDKMVYPDIQINKYGNVSISGVLPDLVIDDEYEICGTEESTKYGISYSVKTVKRISSTVDPYSFLLHILPETKAKGLYKAYPDIVERVRENRLDDVDINKIYGFGEYWFDRAKEAIIKSYCLFEWVSEFQGLLTVSIIKKLYEKYKSLEMLKVKLASNPYKNLCSISGIGFKKADAILLNIEQVSKEKIQKGEEPILNFKEDLKISKDRCLASIMYLLEENETSGNTRMNLVELRSQCFELVPDCANHFVDVIKDNDNTIIYDRESLNVALYKTYCLERNIAKQIVDNLDNGRNIWNYEIEKYRNVDGINITDEQMNVLDNVCKNSISILNGAGGTGKSFCTQAIINMLKDNHKSFLLFSPTGKASKVLSEYTKQQATTIHRGLGYSQKGCYYLDGMLLNFPDEIPEEYDYYSKFQYNKYSKLPCDILIVDEFSMVDVWLFNQVIDAIDFNRTKLLLIGDNAQLPSVQCGNLLHDFMQSKLIPTVTLTKVFRYGEGGLMKVATDVRFCKTYLTPEMQSKVTYFGANQDYIFVDLNSESIPNQTVLLYKKLLQKGYDIQDIQVLTAKNVGDCGTVVLNNMIQKIANPNCRSYSSIHLDYGETSYYQGDLIIQKQNNYDAELDEDYLETYEKQFLKVNRSLSTAFIANGETGIVVKVNIDEGYLVINFDGTYVRYYKSDLGMIGLGYSITIHKSQGSSIKVVILCTPKSHIFMCNSNLLYVGLTRMKEKCFHLGCYDTVNKAVKKKENLKRNTWMVDLLNQINEVNKNEKEN